MAHFSYAVVVERQTRYLEGVVSIGRVGSNPTDRITFDGKDFYHWGKGPFFIEKKDT